MTLIIAKNGILAADRGAFCYTHKFPVSKIKLKKQKNLWRAAKSPANNKFFLVNDDDNQFVTEGEIVARAIARSLHDILKSTFYFIDL